MLFEHERKCYIVKRIHMPGLTFVFQLSLD